MDPATLTERRRSSNPRGRPAAAEAADIRMAILDAAELLFARQGYAATSVRAIAEAVEVTPAMVHYYFGNKLALLRQVLERTLEPLAAAIGKMRVASQAPAADIAHLLLRTFSEHPSLPVLVAREVILPGGVMQQHFLEYLAPRLGGSLHPDLDPQVASLLLLSLCAFPFIAHDLAGPALRIAYDEEGVRRLEHHIERVLQEGFAP
jgi:TetR/AcrR family transcriptional regulator